MHGLVYAGPAADATTAAQVPADHPLRMAERRRI
jgi:hypothetical protein